MQRVRDCATRIVSNPLPILIIYMLKILVSVCIAAPVRLAVKNVLEKYFTVLTYYDVSQHAQYFSSSL